MPGIRRRPAFSTEARVAVDLSLVRRPHRLRKGSPRCEEWTVSPTDDLVHQSACEEVEFVIGKARRCLEAAGVAGFAFSLLVASFGFADGQTFVPLCSHCALGFQSRRGHVLIG